MAVFMPLLFRHSQTGMRAPTGSRLSSIAVTLLCRVQIGGEGAS